MAGSDDGFLSRWSRRKALVRQGAPVADVPPAAAVPVVVPAMVPTAVPAAPATAAEPEVAAPPAPPPPTLDDARALTPDSDFRRFVAPDVAPEVRNTALKQLWADPHFNTMDGLDVYIDDYGRPDPMPASMLRQLVQSKFLSLFEDDDREAVPAVAAEPTAPPDEDPDLRLQPHDAAGPAGTGPQPGEDAGRER